MNRLDAQSILKDHFQQLEECVIIEGNTYLGKNQVSALLGQGIVHDLEKDLQNPHYEMTTINLNDLFLNKTHHLEESLRGNISIRENNLKRYFGMQTAVEKLIEDSINQMLAKNGQIPESNVAYCIGKLLSKASCVLRPVYFNKEEDTQDKKRIADVIREAKEPHFILTTGVNDLMFRARNNPFQLKLDYKARSQRGNYDLTKTLVQDTKLVDKTIEELEQVIRLIQQLNPNTRIYLLNAPMPNNFEEKYQQDFKDMLRHYNLELRKLAKKTASTYINQNPKGEKIVGKNNIFLKRENEVPIKNLVLYHMAKTLESHRPKTWSNHNEVEITNCGIQELENNEFDRLFAVSKIKIKQHRSPLIIAAAQKEKQKVKREYIRGQRICTKVSVSINNQ